MKQIWLTLNLLFVISATVFGGDMVYPSFLIPDTLLKDANAVIRNLECVLTLQTYNKAKYSMTKVVTVLNENGNKHGVFYEFYDDHQKIRGISIKIYNALGRLIEIVKSSDIKDYSAVSGFSLYEDDRVRVYEPVIKSYPYTVIMEVELNYNGYIQFPRWQPQYWPDMSVEEASFTINMSSGNKVRWFQRNIETVPETIKSGSNEAVTWKLNTIPAFERVAFQPPLEEITPNLIVAPSEFSFDGYSGRFNTWQEYGEWVNELLLDRYELSEETVLKMKAMVADANDTLEMVRLIYNYVQQKTRYVSIQYGIGGFQPFEAEVVDRVGYGDCKALTNYTQALLKSVGINSVYTVVNAGKYADDIITDFVYQQFNHVILNVPLNNDTIWLECTNQDMPFGYIGKFTADRQALAITENGGVLIRTKSYEEFPGLTACNAIVEIDENGNGHATLNLSYTGLNYDDIFPFLHQDRDSQEKWLYKNFYISNAEIEQFSIENKPDMIPEAEISIDLKLNKYAGKSGKRLFIPLNKIDALEATPPNDEKRKFDIYIRNAFMEVDTVELNIPDGYVIEHLPNEVNLATIFGSYSTSISTAGKEVNYIRNLEINKGRYPAEDYVDLYDFYKTIVKSDKAKLVLIADD